MHSNTGEIRHFSEELFKELQDQRVRDLERISKRNRKGSWIPLTDGQVEELKPMAPRNRLGRMRNQPCPCGSVKKFKHCCWSKYT